MKKTAKIISSVFVALFISVLGIVGHPSASAMTAHDPVSHKAATGNCAAICLSAPLDKNRTLGLYDEEDDKPEPPYYLQFASAQTGWFAEKQRTFQTNDEPDKVPIYRACCVIRR